MKGGVTIMVFGHQEHNDIWTPKTEMKVLLLLECFLCLYCKVKISQVIQSSKKRYSCWTKNWEDQILIPVLLLTSHGTPDKVASLRTQISIKLENSTNSSLWLYNVVSFKNISFVPHPLGPYDNPKEQKQLSAWGEMVFFFFLFVQIFFSSIFHISN